MSNIQVRLCAGDTVSNGAGLPLANSIAAKHEFVAVGPTSVQSTISSDDLPRSMFWHVKAIGGNMWIKFGSNPVAAEGDEIHLSDGEVYECLVSEANEKLAVVDA